ncbi:MAG: hypothetical protein ACHQF2_02000 [Flavobacteriales bacterium]
MLKIPKPVFFISGALLGGVAVWYFFVYTPEKPVAKTQKKPVVTEPVEVVADPSLQKLNSILKRNEGETQVYPINTVTIESFENIDKNSRLYDSLKAVYKTQVTEEAEIDENRGAETIVVNTEFLKKDKLLGREKVKIISVGINQVSSDSVSAKMTGINPKSTTSLDIEHWVSPVNYKGYKLGRTRLVLFGTQPGAIVLLRYENELYLVFSGKVYPLQASSGFASLKPLQDKKLSASLLNNVN